MLRTRVGYAGGSKERPTYRDLGDHTESIEVVFDPGVISYRQLLDVFWTEHDPCGRSRSTQYKAILFWHDADQRRVAEESAAALHVRRGRPVTTEVVAAGRLWPAEDYHQKYALRRHRGLLADLLRLYPSQEELRDSTAAARLNAWCGGELDLPTLRAELHTLGLEPVGTDRIEGVRVRRPPG